MEKAGLCLSICILYHIIYTCEVVIDHWDFAAFANCLIHFGIIAAVTWEWHLSWDEHSCRGVWFMEGLKFRSVIQQLWAWNMLHEICFLEHGEALEHIIQFDVHWISTAETAGCSSSNGSLGIHGSSGRISVNAMFGRQHIFFIKQSSSDPKINSFNGNARHLLHRLLLFSHKPSALAWRQKGLDLKCLSSWLMCSWNTKALTAAHSTSPMTWQPKAKNTQEHLRSTLEHLKLGWLLDFTDMRIKWIQKVHQTASQKTAMQFCRIETNKCFGSKFIKLGRFVPIDEWMFCDTKKLIVYTYI